MTGANQKPKNWSNCQKFASLFFLNKKIAVLLATVLVVLDAAPYNKRQYYPSQSGYYPSSAYYGGAAGYSADDYYSPYGSASGGYSGSPYYSGYNRRQPTVNSYRPTGYRYPGSLGYHSAAFPGVFGFPRWNPFTRFGSAQPVKQPQIYSFPFKLSDSCQWRAQCKKMTLSG